ncbi:hypothetical protein [Paenibacillus antibioticophila]|uniref:hypothetical protein n=1 Tax=Paenibacillus antibioticophila TaxID=1274374 RepID=UPI0011DDB8E5|nr:hypothetical protein [Paenibacillus antibioticophila]
MENRTNGIIFSPTASPLYEKTYKTLSLLSQYHTDQALGSIKNRIGRLPAKNKKPAYEPVWTNNLWVKICLYS